MVIQGFSLNETFLSDNWVFEFSANHLLGLQITLSPRKGIFQSSLRLPRFFGTFKAFIQTDKESNDKKRDFAFDLNFDWKKIKKAGIFM